MVANERKLRIAAPIGKVPAMDADLHERIMRLPARTEISKVLKEIAEWEEVSVRKSKEREQTAKSGVLHIICR